MRTKINVFLFTILLFINSFVPAQNKDYKIIQLPKEQGAATDLAYKMIIDKKGFLWLGTMFGLVKYDGKNYHTYSNNPYDSTTISFDDIISLLEDNDGYLWVGTWGGGLNKFNPDTEIFERYFYNQDDSTSISSNTINLITQDNLGNMWFASQNGVLNKYIKSTNSFKKYVIPKTLFKSKNNNPDIITSLVPWKNDLIICCKGEIIKFDPADESFKKYFVEETNNELADKHVSLVFNDSKNNYWFGTSSGLYKYSHEKIFDRINFNDNSINRPFLSNFINQITEDLEGNIWIATLLGLNKLSPDGISYSYFSSNSNNSEINIERDISGIVVDKGGIVWVSNYRRGLFKIFKDHKIFQNISIIKDRPNSQNFTIKSIIEDNEKNLLVGSFGKGLLKLNKETSTLENVETSDIIFQNVNSLAAEKDKLWIGSNSGLRLYNFKKKKFEKVSFNNDSLKNFNGIPIFSLLLDSNDILWVGTENQGVYIVNKNRMDFSFIKTNSDSLSSVPNQGYMILNINEDRNKNIWIGTFGGLFKYASVDGSLKLYQHNENDRASLSNNYIFSFHEDNNGNIWIGTANGLNKFDLNKNEFVKYFKTNGLPSSVINGIAEDSKENLWLSTNKGISKFDPVKNEFYSYDSRDGIASDFYIQSSYLKGSDNKIYFGARGGLVVIDPSISANSIYSPPVYITSFIYGNNLDKQTKINNTFNSIEINYDENFVNVEFVALDYSYPERINYEYKLEGFENAWNFSGNNNSAYYKNLPPGKYTFLLRATNGSGVWSKTTAELNFIIYPPPWKTWWFLALIVIALISTAYAAFKISINIKINRALEIEKIKINEREELKRKTAVDFHDEVGYRLTKISILSELIKRKIPESLSSIEGQLINITEISNEIYIGTKDFIWSIDPKNDSVYELFVRLKDFGDEFFNGSKIDFKTDGFNEDLKNYYLSSDWKRHLTLLFKEAMNNSLKHSCANQVILRIHVFGKKLKIEIEDNGKGFLETETFTGSGLKNMRSRAEKINGTIEIESTQGTGTKVIFTSDLPENKL